METKKTKYVPPILIRLTKMTFPMEFIEANGRRVVCRQCSSCHSCRGD